MSLNANEHHSARENLSILRQIKFTLPQTSVWFTPRPRIHALLDQVTSFPLTLVVAPAGYGKTSALGDWASKSQHRIAWFSVDSDDDSLQQFFSSLVTAIQIVEPTAGSYTLSLMTRLDEVISPQQYASSLASELLVLEEPLIVILDDLHHLQDTEVISFLREIIKHPPPMLRLIASSRSNMTLTSASMWASGHLQEITQSDLAFRVDEVNAFLRSSFTGEVPNGVDQKLMEMSEGWITGIFLATLVSQQNHTALDETVNGPLAHHMISEYIIHEVLEKQSINVQNHLLRIAIPHQINQQLALELTRDLPPEQWKSAPLDQLVDAGLFVSSSSTDDVWYRFHSLFRDSLLRRLNEIVDEQTLAQLHRRAYQWFEEQGDIDTALRHALAAGELREGAALVVRHCQRSLIEDRWLQLDRWLSMLPPDLVATNFELLTASAWVQQIRGRHDKMRVFVDRARVLLSTSEEYGITDSVRLMTAELGLLENFDQRNTSHPAERRASLEHAFDILQGSDRFAELNTYLYAPSYLARVNGGAMTTRTRDLIAQLGVDSSPHAEHKQLWACHGLMMAGVTSEHIQTLKDNALLAVETARKLGLTRLRAQSEFLLAMVQLEQNDLEEAERGFRRSYANPHAGVLVFIGSGNRLARTLNALGRVDEADAVLNDLLGRLLASQSTEFLPMVRSSLARIHLARGDVRGAWTHLRALDHSVSVPQTYSPESVTMMYALAQAVDSANPKLLEAKQTLEALAMDPVVLHWADLEIQVQVCLALVEHLSGDTEHAFMRLDPAVAAAEELGYCRLFLDLHPAVVELLRLYHQRHNTSAYVDSVLTAATNRNTYLSQISTPAENFSPLTEREEDVLSGLFHRLSNKEIANVLGISTLTVKSHTRNIYGMLGVNSRRKAVARARQLGLHHGDSTDKRFLD
ncbi:MAG: LuxR C-terminal-related transcriptional regulator [Thermomicrobiales bacterium]|nr:LuxR C-terminal-related transcriptional regulator [Thermomicrobiales bacterium]